MAKKIIFLDIDGTLTEPGKNEPPMSALEAIEKSRRAGNYVFLCSGRNYNMLSPLLKYDFDGAIASSGGYIVCGERVIFDCPMTEEQRNLAMEVLKRNGVFRTVECVDGAFTDDGLKQFLAANATKGSNSEMLRWRMQVEKNLNIRPMSEYQGQPVYKMGAMSPTREQLDEPIRVLSEDFAVVIQEDGKDSYVNGEIVNRKFDKGQAVVRVCEYLGIPVEDSVGFGDSANDREMLEAAGLAICMANGSESLKRLADYVCPAVTDNGLKEAFELFHLA